MLPPSLQAPQQFLFSLCFVSLPVNCSYECSGTLVCLPITHILSSSPIHLVVPSSAHQLHLNTLCSYSIWHILYIYISLILVGCVFTTCKPTVHMETFLTFLLTSTPLVTKLYLLLGHCLNCFSVHLYKAHDLSFVCLSPHFVNLNFLSLQI